MLSSLACDTSYSKFTSTVAGSRFAATVISSGLDSTFSKRTPTLAVVNFAATLNTPGPTVTSTRGGSLRQLHKTRRTFSCLSASDVSSAGRGGPSLADVGMLEGVERLLLALVSRPKAGCECVTRIWWWLCIATNAIYIASGRCRDRITWLANSRQSQITGSR
jgi:hypothetical protein